MKVSPAIVLIVLVIEHKNLANCSIWIKNVKSFGPSSTLAGTKCLTTLTRYYFQEPESKRVKNLVMSYTRNMSTPAENIQRMYLSWIHHALASGNLTEYVKLRSLFLVVATV